MFDPAREVLGSPGIRADFVIQLRQLLWFAPQFKRISK